MATIIWRFSDARAGHDAQTLGLVRALQARVDARVFDVPVRGGALRLWLSGRYPPGAALPRPDLLLGAGHGTHFHLLAARRRWGGRTLVCMKPSLPLSWFDLCLIPEHDAPPPLHNVLVTTGPLNCMQPAGRRDPNTGLILLGGPSRHYRWEDERLLQQVTALIEARPLRRWLLATSPRTPAPLVMRLRKSGAFELLAFPATERDTLAARMGQAGEVWVSEDSVSMLYEALSCGARVGVLKVPRKAPNRITAGVDRLARRGWLAALDGAPAPGAMPPRLDEAGRCAEWVTQRWLNAG